MIVDTDTFLETRQRMSLEEQAVRNFAVGFLRGFASVASESLSDADEWVVWDKYDINFVGTAYTGADMGERDLLVVVYPRDWLDNLPEHLFCFIVEGESK